MYHALYRKYRPVDFDTVVGQDAIVKTLKNSINNKNYSHAYMFFGPRGTGKTTVSKIFARNVNCLNPNNGNACGKCDMCKKTFSNDCVDIIEIDAASNNGVDEIRELKNNVNLVPSELKYKIYIIDEVHMLSTGAFNALLKTLEEPPEHIIFILATTDPQKVPETIISRCQCFSFNRISNNKIVEKLNYVCKKENINIENNVVEKIALLSEGGLRDALGLLDKVYSYSHDKITLEDFCEISGIISNEEINTFVLDIVNGNISEFLQQIENFSNCGKNIIQIIIQIINYLRDIIVNYYLNNENYDISIELYQLLVNDLNDKLYDMKKSGNPKIYVEMLLLKFVSNINNKKRLDNNNLNISQEKSEYNNVNNVNNAKDVAGDIIENNENNSFEDKNIYDNKIVSTTIKKILNINDVVEARINNTFCNASKDLLNIETENFNKLYDFSFDQQIGAIVNTLLDGTLRACGKNDFIISYSSMASVEQNLNNIVQINEVYNKITNSNKNIAIISDAEWDNLKQEYINNLKKNIKYDFVKEPELIFEETDKDDIIGYSAVDLFGEDLVEIE